MVSTTIAKWGNSNGVRLPKKLLDEAGLHEEQPVELVAAEGTIVIRPLLRPRTLDELFAYYEGAYRPREMKWSDVQTKGRDNA